MLSAPLGAFDALDGGAASNHVGMGTMLLRWKRSVYKVVCQELVVFWIVFGVISAVFRYALDDNQKKTFLEAKTFCQIYTNLVSLPFLLGFYVIAVASRWWQQYMAIPWPDKLMLAIQVYIPGESDRCKLLRHALIRRALLMLSLLFRSISPAIRRTYPTLQHLVKKGLMTSKEKELYECTIIPGMNIYWITGVWFVSAMEQAVNEGYLTNHEGSKLVMEEFLHFQEQCSNVWSFNWMNIPMIYTQVCTLSTYAYFGACLVSRQYCGPSSSFSDIAIVCPIWTLLELIFYVGLLKVAEEMKNPFGEDEQDFDLNFLIKRHYKTAFLAVEEVCPPLQEEPLFRQEVNESAENESDAAQQQPGV